MPPNAGTPPTEEERAQIARLRASLEAWALNDIKRAALKEINLPRLAFVGLAAWIDVLTFLRFGRNKGAALAWESFFTEYLPERAADSEVLRDGLRNALLHEYRTRKVALTEDGPDVHWGEWDGFRILDLDSLIAELESAFQRFMTHIEQDADLRRHVLDRSEGLLAAVTLGTPSDSLFPSDKLFPFESAVSASATSSHTIITTDPGPTRD